MVTTSGYNALRWTFCSVAIVTAFGRCYIRWKYFKHGRWDDFFNGLALACLVANFTASVVALETDFTTPLWHKLQLANYMLLWTSLYLVKASFLALYKSIFYVLGRFRIAWWVVVAFTFLSYWPIVLSQLWQCGDPSNYGDPTACSKFTGAAHLSVVQAAFATALHATSDLLILALPLVFISQLHISRVQKVGLSAVFAIVLIDIIMGIIRNVAVLCYYRGYDIESNYAIAQVMGICEPSIAVIVCALPAYRVLLSASSRKRGSTTSGLLQRHGVQQGGMGKQMPSGSTGEHVQSIEIGKGSTESSYGGSLLSRGS